MPTSYRILTTLNIQAINQTAYHLKNPAGHVRQRDFFAFSVFLYRILPQTVLP